MATAGLWIAHGSAGRAAAASASFDSLLDHPAAIVAAIAAIAIAAVSAFLFALYVFPRTLLRRESIVEGSRSEDAKQLRVLLNGVVDYAICMLDAAGRVTNWNSGAERITGYRAEEVLGRHFSIFYPPEAQEAGEPDHALGTARDSGRWEAQSWRLRKDGSRYWANVILDAIRDESGALVGFAKITRDISEMRAVEEELARTRAQLLQASKMEAIDQLTGGVAHDFNNALTVITSSFELLRRHLSADPGSKIDRYIRAGLEATARAAALTARLLAFSRQQTLAPEPCDANQLIANVTHLVRRSLDETIRIEEDLAADLWKLELDTAQFENALVNLAMNARDAMPQGGTLTIATSNASFADLAAPGELAAGDYVLVSVSDTGCGLAEDLVPRVFDPFFTTKPIGIGTGLGLSQVYGFVKQSGGHATFESKLGRGTTVKLYFPRFQGMAATKISAVEPTMPAATAGADKVLVVEDDEAVRQFSVEGLRQLGYSVLEADGGAHALHLIEAHNDLAVLITDIVMPDMNGCKLAEEAARRNPALKVLFMSGYTGHAAQQSRLLVPGQNFLVKPFTLDQLAEKLQTTLPNSAPPRL